MLSLSRMQIRKVFLSEGKIGGAFWNEPGDALPETLTSHRACVAELLSHAIEELDTDDLRALDKVYLLGARGTRTATIMDAPNSMLDPSTVAIRIADLVGSPEEGGVLAIPNDPLARWCDASETIASAVEALSDGSAAEVSSSDALTLYGEIGRLVAPLAIPGNEPLFPEIGESTRRYIDILVMTRLAHDSVYDNSRNMYVDTGFAERQDEFLEHLVGVMMATQKEFFRSYPVGLSLPTDEAAQSREIAHRVQIREAVESRCDASLNALVQPIVDAIEAEKEFDARAEAQRQEARDAAGLPHPGQQPYGVSPRGAELWVRDLLRHFGAADAEATRSSNDGGVDVICESLMVSVKNYAGSVPVEEVREIFAVATVAGKQAALFTSGTITDSGLAFANVAPVALIQYDVRSATIKAINEEGIGLLEILEALVANSQGN